MAIQYGPDSTASTLDGSTSAKAAPSAQHLRDIGITTNGAYYYQLESGVVQLWTDFTSYSNFQFVLAVRLSTADPNQYLAGANNVGDLTVANTTAPTRSAKISDVDMRYIMGSSEHKIKWNIVAHASAWYQCVPGAWYSNSSPGDTCSYERGFYSGYATPSNTPTWRRDDMKLNGACGALQQGDATNGWKWLVIDGIRWASTTYTGGYTGNSSYRATTPSAYLTAPTAGDAQWNHPGYVFLSW